MKAVTTFFKHFVKMRNVGGPILNIESFNFDWIGATSPSVPFDVNYFEIDQYLKNINNTVIYSFNMKLAYVRSYEDIQLKEINSPF